MRVICALLLISTAIGCGSSLPDLSTVRAQMAKEQLAVAEPIGNRYGMVLVPVPAGEFKMGEKMTKRLKKEPWRGGNSPQHLVKITKPFFISTCEITQDQFARVMGNKPWDGKALTESGPNYAASYISWDQANEFCKKLSDIDGAKYRLPTEAEWEYACRSGSETQYCYGDDGKKLGEYAWYKANAYSDGEQYAHQVGQKLPNNWSLYDMHGNVWEWCNDWYAPYNRDQKELVDPTGPERGRNRIWRGGGFSDQAETTRSANRLHHNRRDYRPPLLTGFRVVREME